MASDSESRFRIRMEDGSEVSVPTLEALARRVARGEVLPETPLHDRGTGQWSDARESPVVQFILEEMDPEDRAGLQEWSGEGPTDLEQDHGDLPKTEDPAEAPDPFGLELTLEPDAGGEPSPEAQPSEAEPPESEPSGTLDLEKDPWPSEPEPDSGKEPPEERSAEFPPLIFPDEPEPEPDPEPEPEPEKPVGAEADTAPPQAPDQVDFDDWMAPAEEGGVMTPDPPSRPPPVQEERRPPPAKEERRPSPPRPPREADPAEAPRPSRGARLPILLVAVGILAGGGYFFGDQLLEQVGLGSGPADEVPVTEEGAAERGVVGAALGEMVSVPPAPQGLEEPVDRVLEAVGNRFDVAVDSLRAVHALGPMPPGEWLGGNYLANASRFPEVRSFWENYLLLLQELREMDEEIFLGSASEAAREVAPDAETASTLEEYLEVRYRRIRALRANRYDQLTQAASRALELHDFLEAQEAEIRYTPALGPEVPLDAVLEAGAESPEVHREMLDRLDAVFQALDRSRGGGAPSPGGLSVDLFHRFGEA